MTSREQFEEWAKQQGYINLSRDDHGKYKYNTAFAAWEGWQASRQAVEVELPDSVANTGTLTSGAVLSYKRECREALEAAGIRVAP